MNFAAQLLTVFCHTEWRFHVKKSALKKPTTTVFDVTASLVENCMW